MNALDVLQSLWSFAPQKIADTVDTIKYGSPERSANRVAFCFTATPNVLREAAAWNADVLVTHEPTVYDHFDRAGDDFLTAEKLKLVNECGMTVMRFHDHAHAARPDLIHKAFLGLTRFEGNYRDNRYFDFDAPITARQAASVIAETMGLRHLRLIGSLDTPMHTAALCLGACGDMNHTILRDRQAQLVITGEITEWKSGEYLRDCGEFGLPAAMIIMSHTAAEREGMNLVSRLFAEKHPECAVRYFDCGELLTFLD